MLDLDGNAKRRTVPLTTIVNNQRRAVVRLFLVRGDRTIPVREFDLHNLAPGASGTTRFLLACDYDGAYALKIHLTVDGHPHASATIALRRYLRRGNRLFRTGVPLILLIVVLVLLYLLRGCPSDVPVSTAPARETGTEVARPPAIPDREPIPPRTPSVTEQEQEQVIYFLPDDPRLTVQAEERLESIAREIGSWNDLSITIRGHTALSGTEEGRLDLSRRRAENSAARIIEAGDIDPARITTEWYGAARLITREPEAQHLNRRVEIRVHGTR